MDSEKESIELKRMSIEQGKKIVCDKRGCTRYEAPLVYCGRGFCASGVTLGSYQAGEEREHKLDVKWQG